MNYIENLENLSLYKLESLNLTGNQIRNLDNLEGLINLKELDVSKNKLDNLDYLETDGVCRELFILKCNSNQLNLQYLPRMIEILKEFKHIEEIEFIGNEITLNTNYKAMFMEIQSIKFMDGTPITNLKKEHIKVYLH